MNKNPHSICIWEDKKGCETCDLHGMLQCHEDFHYSLWFVAGFLSFAIPIIIGIFKLLTIRTSLFWYALGSWIIYLIIFFLLWEPQMLCSHCPYYAEGDTKILHCYANHGFYKTAKFNPAPLSRWEQIQFIVGVFLFLIIPIPFLLLGNQILWIGLATLGFIIWMIILQKKICTACINFSCPLNQVPPDKVIKFLDHNPIMQDAWKQAGKYPTED